MNIKDILASNPDGFSLRIEDKELNPAMGGYMVSLTDNEFKSLEDAPRIYRQLIKMRNNLNVSVWHSYVGGWCDESTGKYYLDLSLLVESLEEALTLGRTFGQKAVFDIRNCASIDVEPRRTRREA